MERTGPNPKKKTFSPARGRRDPTEFLENSSPFWRMERTGSNPKKRKK